MTTYGECSRLGRQGEDVVARWLSGRGFFITPTSDIQSSGQTAGPRMRRDGSCLVLPDLQACKSGMSMWVEVKTKSKDVYYNNAKQFRQGIDWKYWTQYCSVEEQSGIPGYMAFLVLSGRPLLRIAPFSRLREHVIDMLPSASVLGYRGRRMVYWCVDIFNNYEIDGVDIRPIPAETKRPWESAVATSPKLTQGYFQFGGQA